MLARLFALFLIVPVVELALLIQLGGLIGFWPTVALILVTAMTGTYLARREGVGAWKRLQQALGTGGLPSTELLDGVLILIAGVFLITPGVITDVVGLLGLLPATRAVIRRQVLKRIDRTMKQRAFHMMGIVPDDPPVSREPGTTSEWSGEARHTPGYRSPDTPSGSHP